MEKQNKIVNWLEDNIFNIFLLQLAGTQFRSFLGEKIEWLRVPEKMPLYKTYFSYKTLICTAGLGVIMAATASLFTAFIYATTKFLDNSPTKPTKKFDKLGFQSISPTDSMFHIPTIPNYTQSSTMAKIG